MALTHSRTDSPDLIAKTLFKGQGCAIVQSSFSYSNELMSFDLPKKIDHVIEIFAVYHTSSRKSSDVLEFIRQEFNK